MEPSSQAVILLCSMVGKSDDSPVRQLSAKEWFELEQMINSSTLEGPGALFGLTAAQLSGALGIQTDYAERIGALLGRAGELAFELERLTGRGIAVVTIGEPEYPTRLRESLKHLCPPVLFVAGAISLLKRGGVAVVGSRNIDELGRAFAEEVGRQCAANELPLISGGARGTDAIAMHSALESGGVAIGVVADSLERAVRTGDLRELLSDGKLSLVTPYSPSASFTIGAAMGRNKIIYGLAHQAVVVSSDLGKGGTWAGATETLKAGWCPVFVRVGEDVPPGNEELLKKGAIPLSRSELKTTEDFAGWLAQRATRTPDQTSSSKAETKAEQQSLF